MNSDQNTQLPATHPNGNVVAYPNNVYPEELLEQSSGLDLREFISVLMQRKKLVLATALTTMLLALLITLLMQPVYRADSTLKVERYAANSNIEILNAEASRSDRDFFETQIQLIQTKSLARRVIDQLGLETQLAPLGLIGRIKAAFSSEPTTKSAQSDTTELLFLENLTVKPINNSQLLKISYDSNDPKLAADISNEIAKTFVRQNLERRFDTATTNKSYIADSIQVTKKSLEEAESRLNAYAKKHGIIQDIDGQSTSSFSLKKQAEVVIIAEKERIEAEAAYNIYIKNPKNQDAAINTANNPYILSLQKAAARLETKFQSLRSKRSSTARQLRKQIKGLQEQIIAESEGIQGSLKSVFLKAKQKEDMLRVQFDKQKINVLNLQGKNTRYNTLAREVEINQIAYNKQLDQLMSFTIAENIGTNNISVIDTAGVPTKKHKPSLRTNLAFGGLLGLLLGMGIAFLREFIDDSVKTADNLERLTGLPVLSQMPEVDKLNSKQLALQTASAPKSAIAESIRSLRTSLRFSTPNGSPHSIFITSTSAGEGKSTVALNLATAYAQAGSSVLLIDADLRNPSLHNLLGLENLKGLTNLLAGSESDLDISRTCMIQQLRVITSGPIPPDPVELLSGNKMVELFKLASEKYDHIIIDGPPVLGLADALVIANLSAATIITVQAGKTRKGELLDALKRLERARANIVGSILSRVSRATNPDYNQEYYTYTAQTQANENPAKPRLRSL